MTQDTFEGMATPPQEPARPAPPDPVGDAKPIFRRYRVTDPYKCDRCVQAMLSNQRGWSAPERATYIYYTRKGAEPEYLCFGHANDQRSAHGLERLKR